MQRIQSAQGYRHSFYEALCLNEVLCPERYPSIEPFGSVAAEQMQHFRGLASTQFLESALTRDQRTELDQREIADYGCIDAAQSCLGSGTQGFRAVIGREHAGIDISVTIGHRALGVRVRPQGCHCHL